MLNIEKMKRELEKKTYFKQFGEIHTLTGNTIISKGPICKIGDLCAVGEEKVLCEVISLKGSDVYLMPLSKTGKLSVKDKVFLKQNHVEIPPVQHLLGRTIDGMGFFIDDKNQQVPLKKIPLELDKNAPDAMKRKRINNILPTGIKAIDSMLTMGEGQRIGLFAGTGVGKSTLLGQIARYAKADVNVICLIGERGREVREFIEHDLGEEGIKRSVVVVSTSDEEKLMQIKAAQLATSIAEEFRDQGKKVLLMMDSIYRFAKAREDIDKASGETPDINGKTPSMERYMQRLLERAGMNEYGSITGIYTVLVEGDDFNGAIPDMARGILDGHIYLDREIAQNNQFPAINILNSISRVMDKVVEREHWDLAREIKKYMALYKQNEQGFRIGAIPPGDRELDLAKALYPIVNGFLKQEIYESFEFEEILSLLKEAVR